MRIRHYMVLWAITVAGSAAADARFDTSEQRPLNHFSLAYAQVQIDDLAERDLRRMIYYADRATTTLQTMVEGADTRSIYEQDKANKRFRESIVRLADAGARSGLSMDQVADYYTQIVFDKFGQSFMQQVGALAGGLDFRTLFRNVATIPDPDTNAQDEGASFLEALSAASQTLELDTAYAENGQLVEINPAAQNGSDRPTAFPNANAIELNIIDRIEVVDGQWQLTVRAGDSLSTIASAIYGNALAYTTIYGANTQVINNPNVIDVGTLLVLPKP